MDRRVSLVANGDRDMLAFLVLRIPHCCYKLRSGYIGITGRRVLIGGRRQDHEDTSCRVALLMRVRILY